MLRKTNRLFDLKIIKQFLTQLRDLFSTMLCTYNCILIVIKQINKIHPIIYCLQYTLKFLHLLGLFYGF
jgi:hypothetical protein